ncbi:MAG: CCA tRNA nucleotidyltransferase [Lentisphaeria bacterium]|nr:CCA tRNA nucleotidyltransferase [Lentisphaeria bacterium]
MIIKSQSLWHNTKLENSALKVVKQLHQAGYEAYFVGGCVRDALLGIDSKDIDITTSAKPKQIVSLFKRTIPVGEAFGVITVVLDDFAFEVATFRAESDYTNGRHPNVVHFANAKEDAIRRDFTINALFYNPVTEEIVDFSTGLADLADKRLRTIGSAQERFNEDYLRMLRAVRFSAKLNFTPDAELIAAIKTHADHIIKISSERIFAELSGILISGRVDFAFELMSETGLLAHILPEVEALRGCPQNPFYHPEGDVWNHTMAAIKQLSKNCTTSLAWGILLHDIGKPKSLAFKPDGSPTSHGHELAGAKIANQILIRLRAPNQLIKLVDSHIRCHMKFHSVQMMKESTLRKFVAEPDFEEKLALHKIDSLAGAGRLENYQFTADYLLPLQKTGSLELPKPLITGKELKALGLKPGKEFGNLLKSIQTLQLDGKINSTEEAMDWVKNQGKQNDN